MFYYLVKIKRSLSTGVHGEKKMPFANEHAAQQRSRKDFKKFRRRTLAGNVPGISFIFGITDGKGVIQSIRFDKNKFTVGEAKEWLRGRGFKVEVEAATTESQEESTKNSLIERPSGLFVFRD
jgi:hypothetical protein